ncbi:hypothetical protein GCM10009037_28110 [Halarchaeum grantii]|uniref:Uncharacterized protein n=1 Tax=Halarchaeum grantii TaxID=1193105 RepID=A0A830FD59_9EURY|nr:hypothetical protein [Halarchaeum grantii]GGL42981.1 hypothetical protein GCM10009037_28110 [Halarchaeum grantii]
MTTQGETLVEFDADGRTLTVRDVVMEASCTFTASDPTDPIRVSTDRFLFPVDAAVSFETASLSLPAHAGVYVRDEEGQVLGHPTETSTEYLPGTYYVGITSYCKLYVKVFDAALETSMDLHNGTGAVDLEFGEPTRVAVGARSLHERPAATITVPDEPSALREALPYLASGIKEWSCERSWPTLRGHPPRLERGGALAIPDALSRPETGVTIAVPETYAALYTVAPLVYYLGADVVPATDPEIRLKNGYTEPLGAPDGALTRRVRSLLGRCLFLDSLVRTAGYHSVDRQEYEAVAGNLPFYPPELYDAAIPEQLMEYLEVEAELLERYVPAWSYDVVLDAEPADAKLLPHVLNSVSPVRMREVGTGVESICDGYGSSPVPTGATHLSVAGFEHNLDAPPREVASERVALVGVDAESDAMDALSATLTGTEHREVEKPFDVKTVEATREGVRTALETEAYGFVHIGVPLTDAGFVCADGVLRPEDVEEVAARVVSVVGDLSVTGSAVDAFVERGACLAFATTALPSHLLGHLLGRLLSGAPFAKAVEWGGFDGIRYRFAGDVASRLVAREGGTWIPEYAVESMTPDEHRLSVITWGGDVGAVSAIESPYIDSGHWLAGQRCEQPGTLTSEEVVDLVDDQDGVYVLNGEVVQRDGVTVTAVRDSARRALDDVASSETTE